MKLLSPGLLVGIMVFGPGAVVALRGANYYVRAGAAGSGNGSDWNNAYPVLPANPLRGSTYYVATGIYPGYTFNTAESGTNAVTVLKATVADHGTSTGWNDNHGTGTAVFTNTMWITRGYFTLDGRTGGGPGSWTNGFGFKIQSLATVSPNPGISVSDNRKGVTLRHFEVQGNGGDGDGGGLANDALAIGVNTDYTTVSHAYLHDMGRTLIFGHGNNMFFEYVYGGKFESTDVEHAEIASLWASIPPVSVCTNVTFANCVWSHCDGTGGLIMYADGVKIYGNVFYRLPGVTFPPANGGIATWNHAGSIFARGRIFNNSFINLGQFAALGIGYGQITGDNLVANNLFYNCQVDFGGVTLHDYNLFINTSGASAASEAHGTTGNAAIFNDYLALNFTLKSNTPAGTNVGAPYNVDPNGAPRTTWTRGAYEFGSSHGRPQLKLQRTDNQMVFSWPDTGASYRLCVATNLEPAAGWTVMTNVPVLAGGQWSVTTPVSSARQQFFRLVQP